VLPAPSSATSRSASSGVSFVGRPSFCALTRGDFRGFFAAA
jgi:hypothetical protein